MPRGRRRRLAASSAVPPRLSIADRQPRQGIHAGVSFHDIATRYPFKARSTGPSDRDYERLLGLRTGLRRFLHWSEAQAHAAGLTPAQHQLLLVIRGHGSPCGPTIAETAEYLVLRHHSAVGLIDRAAAAGLVVRTPDHEKPGTVRLSLTALGAERLDALAEVHMEELARLAPTMEALWRTFGEASPDAPQS
jgi:DNA-binding MarR family transcriptional regulator